VIVRYLDAVRHLIAWCELRQDFRDFRTDGVIEAEFLDQRYPERPSALKTKWRRTLEQCSERALRACGRSNSAPRAPKYLPQKSRS
jgi:predicted DNA-binding transcriptional regulator YafY